MLHSLDEIVSRNRIVSVLHTNHVKLVAKQQEYKTVSNEIRSLINHILYGVLKYNLHFNDPISKSDYILFNYILSVILMVNKIRGFILNREKCKAYKAGRRHFELPRTCCFVSGGRCVDLLLFCNDNAKYEWNDGKRELGICIVQMSANSCRYTVAL